MALIQCHFFSDVLGLSTSMTVILPQATERQIGLKGRADTVKHPTLFLLHGMSDDCSIWLRRTSIERYVAPRGLAVVMPEVGRSYYTDMAHGLKYWTFISEELPRIARSFFPLSDKREDNFVAGLSMGGYGAFKLALRKPESFAAAASLSGALDIKRAVKSWLKAEGGNIFGDTRRINGSENDLFSLARKAKKQGMALPKLYQVCGTEDFVYQDNVKFKRHAERLKLDLDYHEGPGSHEWGFWDNRIRDVLRWLPMKKKGI